MTGEYWFSCKQGTGLVVVKDKIVIKTCPLFRWAIGRNVLELSIWARGEQKWKKLPET